MKNVLIFLSIFTVVMLAVIDAKERIKELDTIAGKTPAQVEMKDDILNPSRDKTKENVNLDIQSQQNRNNFRRSNFLYSSRFSYSNSWSCQKFFLRFFTKFTKIIYQTICNNDTIIHQLSLFFVFYL